MTKELEGLQEGPKAEIHIDLLKTTLKNIKLENARPWWNTRILLQETHLYSRQTSTRNEQMPRRSTHTRKDDQRKDLIDPEGSTQRNRPKQLLNHNLTTGDVENINSTNKGRFTTRWQAADCSLRNRKDASKDPEAQESYFT